jgi:polyisoprenoid-binding protein YceI
MSTQFEAKELREIFTRDGAGLFLHVLPEDAFAEWHIPGSKNLCVYESAFPVKVGEAFPDKDAALVVYSFNDDTREAEVALETLLRAGYTKARRLTGGLASWAAAGGAVEGPGPAARGSLSGRYVVDVERSVIFWTGRNLFNHHTGSLSLREGSAELRDDALVAASFTVDMDSIGCTDIKDPNMNALLIGHLKSDDFFAVADYPTAQFVAKDVVSIANSTTGTDNYTVRGEFTLRGQSRPLELSVNLAADAEGGLAAQALCDLDRTEYGGIYGSGKFFSRLGQHVVNDLVHLHLKLFLKRA